MPLTLTRSQALHVARVYAARYDVPWLGVTKTRTYWAWWLVTAAAYQFEVDTGGAGEAVVVVGVPFRGVVQCEFRPVDPARYWLPPWAAYPSYSSVTMGWREGSGESYIIGWWKWYSTLSDATKASYRERFPEPDRDGWPGFYKGWRE